MEVLIVIGGLLLAIALGVPIAYALALAALAGGTAEELASGLEEAVSSFRRSARDDIAILVLQVVAPA